MRRPEQTRVQGERDRRPFKRRGHILLSLMAVLVFVGLAPLASVAWKLIDSNREALTTAHQEYQMLLASSVAREVDLQVEGMRTQLVRIAQALGAAIERRGTIPRAEVRRILADVADDRLVFLRFRDLRGRTVDSLAKDRLPEQLRSLVDTGLREAAELLEADPGSRPEDARFSPPILLGKRSPRAALVGSAPVVSDGRSRGVLSGVVDLQSVWRSVVEKNRTGYTIFALDSTGLLFASSDPSRYRPGREVRHSEIVQRFLDAEGRATVTMPFELEEDGDTVRYLGSFNVTRLGWGIFVQARRSDAYRPVRTMMESTASWALAALALAILAAVFFAGTLSKPINRLAAASRAFAAGDFSARVSVRSRNEIGELAETFNRMAAEIEEFIRRVKRAAEENNELFLGTIRALAQAIDAKDPYTRGHSMRVNKYSVIIARNLGLSGEEIRDINVSSLLHDVGKIGIDDSILKKPGMLTHEEFNIMKAHPVLGANIMEPIRQMEDILPGLRFHHERWNGSGYPDGLQEDNIPLMARIIAVADTFDAMTTQRPYQNPMTSAQAHAKINDLTGIGFDDRVVEAFNRAYHAGEIRPDEQETSEPVQAAS